MSLDDSDILTLIDSESDPEYVGDFEIESVRLVEAVVDHEVLGDAEKDCVDESVIVGDVLRELVSDAVSERDGDDDQLRVDESDGDSDVVRDSLCDADRVVVEDSEDVFVGDRLSEAVAVCDVEDDPVKVSELVPVGVIVEEADSLRRAE